MEKYLLKEIRLQNFRCFRTKQTARLAPLTLLVGDNSTGKTSLLAALRAVLDVAYRPFNLDFRASPYDLGAFSDIVHNSNHKGATSTSFNVGFTSSVEKTKYEFDVTFESRAATPYPVAISIESDDAWVRVPGERGDESTIDFGIDKRAWRINTKRKFRYRAPIDLPFPIISWAYWILNDYENSRNNIEILKNTDSPPNKEDYKKIENIIDEIGFFPSHERPFASAPIRSSPRRTYDPTKPEPDPEGRYVPTYLANLYVDQNEWKQLKRKLEKFGRSSGLFRTIGVKELGDAEGGPFQLEIDIKNGRGRNLIDVGYGVSQVLPVIAELFRPDGPSMFFFQQPEVHLHPSAQAALGSLFCQTASSGRQLIIETHSDYILDRILLDIRDKRTKLKAKDISILFFERKGQNVSISSIKIDEKGEVLDTPKSYRRFFTDELKRVIDY